MKTNLNEMIGYDPDRFLPEDCLLDEFHPANDDYLKKQRRLEKMLINAQQNMRPKHVAVAKLKFNNMNNIEIGRDLRMNPQSVGLILQRKDVSALTTLMSHYRIGRAGPNEDQKVAMLWRIAVRNEEDRPSIAKDAIAELNRMDSAVLDRELASKQASGAKISITINQKDMPRTTLDG